MLHALIPCAGYGARFGSRLPKQYQPLAGATVLDWSIKVLLSQATIASITLIHAPTDDYISSYIERYPQLSWCNQGGNSRAETVRNGLSWLAQQPQVKAEDWVLVHDAARCCLHPKDLERLIITLINQEHGGILATPAIDTLKLATQSQLVQQTLDRNQIWQAQTPQMFRLQDLLQALSSTQLESITDEASAIERCGGKVQLVAAQHPNPKLTYAHDLAYANWLLQQR